MTKKELIEALSGLDDDDCVVVEIEPEQCIEDLYDFTIQVIEGIQLMDGSVIREIRICPIQNEILQ